MAFNNQLTGGSNKPVLAFGFSEHSLMSAQARKRADDLVAQGILDPANIVDLIDKDTPIAPGTTESSRAKYEIAFVAINDQDFSLKDVVITVKDPFRAPNPKRSIEHVSYNLKTKSFDSRDDQSTIP